MSSPVLALNNRDGSPTVHRYSGASPTQVGNALPGVVETGDTNEFLDSLRVTQFKGPDDLYAVKAGIVYQYTVGTGNWAAVHTFATFIEGQCFGPFVVTVDGEPTMVVVNVLAAATFIIAATSVNGTVWVEGASHANTAISGSTCLYSAAVYRNRIHFFMVNELVVYDAGLDTFSFLALTGTFGENILNHAFAVFQDRTFVSGMVTGEHREIHEFIGASLSLIDRPFAGANGTSNTDDAKDCLFTDGTNLYYLFYESPDGGGVETTHGIHCYKYTSALTPSDISATVIPTSLRFGQGTGTAAKRGTRIRALIDSEANPGGPPVIWLYISQNGGNPGTPWSVFRWNGDAALIGNAGSANDVGGDSAHAISFDPRGSGKQFYTEGELDVDHVEMLPIVGGSRISFRPRSVSGTETVSIEITFGTNSEFPTTQAQLVNPSEGSMSANIITGVTADGATKTVDWQAGAQGVNTGDRIQTRIRVFVP